MSSNERDQRWFNFDHHHHPSTYDLNSKIMLAAVVSLSTVILVVFSLHLYARFVLRRRQRELASRGGLPLTFRYPFQTPKRGLDPTVIASLPTFKVGAMDDDVAASSSECSVCLSVLEEQETARELPNCKHVFHVDCVDTWLATCSTCPVCRTEVVVGTRERVLEPEPREGPVGGDGEVRMNLSAEAESTIAALEAMAAASSSSSYSDKAIGSSISRLDSFKRILTRERSSNRINHNNHSCIDQDRVAES